ncbi:hypothetical protein PG990_014597 [Apiospora arundinis]
MRPEETDQRTTTTEIPHHTYPHEHPFFPRTKQGNVANPRGLSSIRIHVPPLHASASGAPSHDLAHGRRPSRQHRPHGPAPYVRLRALLGAPSILHPHPAPLALALPSAPAPRPPGAAAHLPRSAGRAPSPAPLRIFTSKKGLFFFVVFLLLPLSPFTAVVFAIIIITGLPPKTAATIPTVLSTRPGAPTRHLRPRKRSKPMARSLHQPKRRSLLHDPPRPRLLAPRPLLLLLFRKPPRAPLPLARLGPPPLRRRVAARHARPQLRRGRGRRRLALAPARPARGAGAGGQRRRHPRLPARVAAGVDATGRHALRAPAAGAVVRESAGLAAGGAGLAACCGAEQPLEGRGRRR